MVSSQGTSKALDNLFSAVDDGSSMGLAKKTKPVADDATILKRPRRDVETSSHSVPVASFPPRLVLDVPAFSKPALPETPAPRVRRVEIKDNNIVMVRYYYHCMTLFICIFCTHIDFNVHAMYVVCWC